MKEKNYIKIKPISIAKTMMLLGFINVYITSCNTQEHGNNFKYKDQCNKGDIHRGNILDTIKLQDPKDKEELILDFFEAYNVDSIELVQILNTANLNSPNQCIEKFFEKNEVSYDELKSILKDPILNEDGAQDAVFYFIERGNKMTYENFVQVIDLILLKNKENDHPTLVNNFIKKIKIEWKEAISLIIKYNKLAEEQQPEEQKPEEQSPIANEIIEYNSDDEEPQLMIANAKIGGEGHLEEQRLKKEQLEEQQLIKNIAAVCIRNPQIQVKEAFEFLQTLNLGEETIISIIIAVVEKDSSLCNLIKCLEVNVCDYYTKYRLLETFIENNNYLKFQDLQKIARYVAGMDEHYKEMFLDRCVRKIDVTLTELIEFVKMINGGDRCNNIIICFAKENLNKITPYEFANVFNNNYTGELDFVDLATQFFKLTGNNFETFILILKSLKHDSVKFNLFVCFLFGRKFKTEESIRIVEAYHQIFKACITSNKAINTDNLQIDAASLSNYFNSKTESRYEDDDIKQDFIGLFFRNNSNSYDGDIKVLKAVCIKDEMCRTDIIKSILHNYFLDVFEFDFLKSQLLDLGYKNIPEDLLLRFLYCNKVDYKKFIVEVLPCFLKEESKSRAVELFLEKTKISGDEFKVIIAEAKFQDKQYIVPLCLEFLKNTKVTFDAFLEILTSIKNISTEVKYKLLHEFLYRSNINVDELIRIVNHKELINLKNDKQYIVPVYYEVLRNTKVTVDAFLEILASIKDISTEAKYKLLSAFLKGNKNTTVDKLIEMFKHKELINLKNDAEKIWELFKIVRSKTESKVVIELQKFFQTVYPFSEAMQMGFFIKGIYDHLINSSNFKLIDFDQIQGDDYLLDLLECAAAEGIIPANDEKIILGLVRNRCHSVYASIIELY